MWWIIVIAVVGLIIYNINKDHKEHVNTHVSNFGGMIGKYGVVINYLKSSGLSIQKQQRIVSSFLHKVILGLWIMSGITLRLE